MKKLALVLVVLASVLVATPAFAKSPKVEAGIKRFNHENPYGYSTHDLKGVDKYIRSACTESLAKFRTYVGFAMKPFVSPLDGTARYQLEIPEGTSVTLNIKQQKRILSYGCADRVRKEWL